MNKDKNANMSLNLMDETDGQCGQLKQLIKFKNFQNQLSSPRNIDFQTGTGAISTYSS